MRKLKQGKLGPRPAAAASGVSKPPSTQATGLCASNLRASGPLVTGAGPTVPPVLGATPTRRRSYSDTSPGPSAASPLHLLNRAQADSSGEKEASAAAPNAGADNPSADDSSADPSRNQLSTMVRRRGYVTTLSSLLNKTPQEIEDTIGYERGSLKDGYTLHLLVSQAVMPAFKWRGVTSDVAGWTYDRDCDDFVPCEFLQREKLAKANDYDDAKTDSAMARFMIGQAWRVNVRDGADAIVKVVPNGQVTDYVPGNGAPQWELVSFLAFKQVASIQPGQPLILNTKTI